MPTAAVGTNCCSDLVFDKAYESNNSNIWNLWLSSVGIILLIWRIVNIDIYIRKINKIGKDDFKLVEGPDGELNMEIPMTRHRKNVPEY